MAIWKVTSPALEHVTEFMKGNGDWIRIQTAYKENEYEVETLDEKPPHFEWKEVEACFTDSEDGVAVDLNQQAGRNNIRAINLVTQNRVYWSDVYFADTIASEQQEEIQSYSSDLGEEDLIEWMKKSGEWDLKGIFCFVDYLFVWDKNDNFLGGLTAKNQETPDPAVEFDPY